MTNKICWKNTKPINMSTKLIKHLISSLYDFLTVINLVSSAEGYYGLNIASKSAIVSYKHKVSNWVRRKTNVSKYVTLSKFFLLLTKYLGLDRESIHATKCNNFLNSKTWFIWTLVSILACQRYCNIKISIGDNSSCKYIV